MDKQQTMLINQATDNIDLILKDLYRKLSEGPFSLEALADAGLPYFTDMTWEQLVSDIRKIYEGIKAGSGEFDRLNNLPQESLNQEIPRQLEQCLEGLPESQQRQYLLLLYQMLYLDSGHGVNGNISIYLANMPTDEMKKGICFLFEKKGQEIAGNIPSLLSEAKDKFKASNQISIMQKGFSDEEKDIILATAVYASMQKAGGVTVHTAEQIGEQIGFEKSFMKRFGEAMHDVVIPVALRLLTIAAIAAAAYFLLKWMIANELFTFAYAYIEKNHLWKIAVPAVATAVTYAGSWFVENMLSDPIIYRAQGQVEDTKTEVERYFDETALRADAFADRIRNDTAVVAEDESNELISEEESNGVILA